MWNHRLFLFRLTSRLDFCLRHLHLHTRPLARNDDGQRSWLGAALGRSMGLSTYAPHDSPSTVRATHLILDTLMHTRMGLASRYRSGLSTRANATVTIRYTPLSLHTISTRRRCGDVRRTHNGMCVCLTYVCLCACVCAPYRWNSAQSSGVTNEQEGLASSVYGFGAVSRRTTSCKPLIAAVNGGAHGGGTEMVLNCDLVVTGEDAKFALPEVKRGVVAAQGGMSVASIHV